MKSGSSTTSLSKNQTCSEDTYRANEWIAIGARSAINGTVSELDPPSFDQARFDVVLRRKRERARGERKPTAVPSRFLNLQNDFEFAGWGTVLRLTLDKDHLKAGEEAVQEIRRKRILGQFTASALAGNAVLGSVFYALPAVVAVSSIYSPISLLIATLVLFLWRPVMEELGSALPISGGPYTYMLNVSSKSFALVGAALLLLDFGSTAVVSAATAASYLAGEVSLPFPTFVGATMVLGIFTIISLSGMQESARLALGVLTFHVVSMVILIITSAIHWGKMGNTQLTQNWHDGQASSTQAVFYQVYNGFCLGMLGLTGFECIPSYVGRIKSGKLPLVLRNLHIPAIILNSVIMLLVLAVVPLKTILGGTNVLSVLAEMSVGRWLRTWIVVDAVVVLCGGVLTGIISACELMEQLARHRVLPRIFLRTFPMTNALYIAIFSFIGFSGVLYASASADLNVVSQMFSLVWLTVMSLFPISLLLLKFNRGRLSRGKQASLMVVFLAILVSVIVFAGNIAVNPKTAGYFAAYFLGITALFMTTQNKARILRWGCLIYDQSPLLRRYCITKNVGQKLIAGMKKFKKRPVAILVKSDEINHLFRMISYVKKNEETDCIKMVCFAGEEFGLPEELEANARILDEAFPEITIDLVIVQATFNPASLNALSRQFEIPTSMMFMSCPGTNFPYSMAELGTRIVSL